MVDLMVSDKGSEIVAMAAASAGIAASFFERLAREVCTCGKGHDCHYLGAARDIAKWSNAASAMMMANAGVEIPVVRTPPEKTVQ
jgi:hypothetical protein